jgi:hypothetical protein
MTEILTKVIVDCFTGESTVLPLTTEELEQRELDRLAYEAQEELRLQAEADKAALEASAVSKLTALGLTAEEISALKN